MLYTPWSRCSRACGGGVQTRSAQCVSQAGAAQASMGACSPAGARPIASLQTSLCNTAACASPYWTVPQRWSTCSLPCVGSDGVVGTSQAEPSRCMSPSVNGSVVEAAGSLCEAAGLVRPASQVACNVAACPQPVLASWLVGDWGECTAPSTAPRCGTRYGVSERRVVCAFDDGYEVDDVECVDGGVVRPLSSRVCAVDGPECGCRTMHDCPSAGTSECRGGVCECLSGWGGFDCSVELMLAASGSACVGGVVDVAGTCCTGLIDSGTGACCSGGAATDADGSCCAAGVAVDGCGVCGGNGVAVDVTGLCCTTLLTPSGHCCVNSTVDSCGVCGGMNSCGVEVSVSIDGSLAGAVTSDRLAAALLTSVGHVTGVSLDRQSGPRRESAMAMRGRDLEVSDPFSKYCCTLVRSDIALVCVRVIADGYDSVVLSVVTAAVQCRCSGSAPVQWHLG